MRCASRGEDTSLSVSYSSLVWEELGDGYIKLTGENKDTPGHSGDYSYFYGQTRDGVERRVAPGADKAAMCRLQPDGA